MKITITDKVYITDNISVNNTTTITVNGAYDTDDMTKTIIDTIYRIDRKTRKTTE